jgi:hypothetical protein
MIPITPAKLRVPNLRCADLSTPMEILNLLLTVKKEGEILPLASHKDGTKRLE